MKKFLSLIFFVCLLLVFSNPYKIKTKTTAFHLSSVNHANKLNKFGHVNCVDPSYIYDEANGPYGPSQCFNDCECDNTRKCSPSGKCAECLDLAKSHPDFYSEEDCYSSEQTVACHSTCKTCEGTEIDQCTTCSEELMLVDGRCVKIDEEEKNKEKQLEKNKEVNKDENKEENKEENKKEKKEDDEDIIENFWDIFT